MTQDAREVWIVEVDEEEVHFDTKEQVAEYLSSLEQQSSGRVWVLIDHGPAKGWRRFLGTKGDTTPCFAAEWESGYASLIFFDDAWSEFRAMDAARPVMPSEEVRRKIAHGELGPHPTAECMEKSRAFAAMRDFLGQDGRPDWLTYKYVP